jgi:hypothetical protein
MFRAALLTFALVLFGSTIATAQPSVSAPSQAGVRQDFQLPSVEFGAQMSSDGTAGARVGFRRFSWLVREIGFERSIRDRYDTPPGQEMLIANLRLQDPTNRARDPRVFATAGIAVLSNRPYSWSPVLGVGGQVEGPTGVGALRVEFQMFTRDKRRNLLERGRLRIGFTLGMP